MIGNIIANKSKSKDPMYDRNLAMKVYNSEGPIELNTRDITIIDKAIKHANLPVLTEGQMREALECPEMPDDDAPDPAVPGAQAAR